MKTNTGRLPVTRLARTMLKAISNPSTVTVFSRSSIPE